MMDILLSAQDIAFNVGIVIAEVSSNNIVKIIRNFIGPIVLLIVSLLAITFLFRREMTQFIIFIVIGVVVLAIFYVPDFIANLGKNVGKEGKNW